MGKRILVVNDTQEILDLFRALLEDAGYEPILSGFPFQKLSDIEQVNPDLIVLDLLFNDEKTGWQMLQLLKMSRTTALIPVIICTAALKTVREQEGYLNAQNVRIVYKPFDIDILLETVKLALEDHAHIAPTIEAENKEPGELDEKRDPSGKP